MAQVLLAALGSAGDVFPFIQIGAALKARGHEVTLIASERFSGRSVDAGLRIRPLRPVVEGGPQTDTRKVRLRIKTSRKLVETGANEVYRAIVEEARPGQLVVAANTWCLGARFAQEKLGIPLVSIHGVPSAIRSMCDTAVYYRGFDRLYRIGLPIKRVLLRLIDRCFFDLMVAPELNVIRRKLGLNAISWYRDPGWIHSPKRVVGLWPEWFGSVQPDWPPQTVLSGFVSYDLDPSIDQDRLRSFTGDASQRYAIFNMASWVSRSREWVGAAAQMARQLNLRVLVLSTSPPNQPVNLGELVTETGYVPLRQLMPGAKVVIHNGGIGTAAHAFECGVPQMVIPIAGDHFDNCARIVRLGAGVQLYRGKMSGRRLADRMRLLLGSGSIREKCTAWKARCESSDIGLTRVCDWVEDSVEDWQNSGTQ